MDVLGIDLAKLTFDVTLLTTTGAQHYQSFPNTPDGFTQLQAWLSQYGVMRPINWSSPNVRGPAVVPVLRARLF